MFQWFHYLAALGESRGIDCKIERHEADTESRGSPSGNTIMVTECVVTFSVGSAAFTSKDSFINRLH